MHGFNKSIGNPNLCGICKRPQIDHTENATCESCPNVGKMEIHETMLMCPDCITRERNSYSERMSATAQATRVNEMNAALAKSHEIDAAINIISDLFNAETVSIVELHGIINNDENIVNKAYAISDVVKTRFLKNQQLIFDANKVISDAVSRQKAEQVYLNTLANQLTAAEREKLKISDINYPGAPVKVSKPAKIAVKKIDIKEVKRFAADSGIPVYMIQQECLSKNVSPEDATKNILSFIEKNKKATS